MSIATDWDSLSAIKTPEVYKKLSRMLSGKSGGEESQLAQLQKSSRINFIFLGSTLVVLPLVLLAMLIFRNQLDSATLVLLGLIALAFVGLGLIALLGLIANRAEEVVAQRLMLLKQSLDLEHEAQQGYLAKEVLVVVKDVISQQTELPPSLLFGQKLAELAVVKLDAKPLTDVARVQQDVLELLVRFESESIGKTNTSLSEDVKRRARSIYTNFERNGYDA